MSEFDDEMMRQVGGYPGDLSAHDKVRVPAGHVDWLNQRSRDAAKAEAEREALRTQLATIQAAFERAATARQRSDPPMVENIAFRGAWIELAKAMRGASDAKSVES